MGDSKSELRISEPFGPQSSSFVKWSKTLRSPTSSGFNPSGTVFHFTMPTTSTALKKTGTLRKSTGNLSTSLNATSTSKLKQTRSAELDRIESEYIKNLQQQVYFLELESAYLREQAKNATDMQPTMSSEAERMLRKLRLMQGEMDNVNIELKRKTASEEMIKAEKDRLEVRLKSEADAHQREKRLLLEEIVQLKKEKDLLERDNQRKDGQILGARDELDQTVYSVRDADTKIQMLQNQLDQKSEQLKLTQNALDEKRADYLKIETQLRQMEEKYYSSSASIKDKTMEDLREELRMLRQRLKEAELSAEQDRYLRTKVTDDSAHLIKENALLNQQVLELQKQLEREKELRESQESRRSQGISEVLMAKDRESQLKGELSQMREQLKRAEERISQLIEQIRKQDHLSSSQQLSSATMTSRLRELEGYHQNTESENTQLRRDKMLLVDHVADLQKQLSEKDKTLNFLQTKVSDMEAKTLDMENLKSMEAAIHSQKWEEFSRMAETMKTLSRSMARPSTLEYS